MRGKLKTKKLANKFSKNSSGFTLTEVMVASALLIMAMVPILKALTQAHVSSFRIEQKSRSLSLAQTKLDELKARSIYNYSGNFGQTGLRLSDSYLCNIIDTSQGSDLRRLEVSVGYDINGNNSLGSDEVFVTLQTLVARRW